MKVGERYSYPDIHSAIFYHFLIQIHRFKNLPGKNTGDQKDAKEDSCNEYCLVPIHLAHSVVFLAVRVRNQRTSTILNEFDSCWLEDNAHKGLSQTISGKHIFIIHASKHANKYKFLHWTHKIIENEPLRQLDDILSGIKDGKFSINAVFL